MKIKLNKNIKKDAGGLLIVSFLVLAVFFIKLVYIGNEITEDSNGVQRFLLSGTVETQNPLEMKIHALNEEITKQEVAKQEVEFAYHEKVMEIQKLQELSKAEKIEKQEIVKLINNNAKGRLAGKGETYYYAAKQWGVNPIFMFAINQQETGDGLDRKSMLWTHNNAGGLFIGGTRTYFPSIDSGLYEMARRINIYYINAKTPLLDIKSFGNVYCPIGVANDPTGLNKHWIPNVTKFYEALMAQTYLKFENVVKFEPTGGA